MSTPSAIWNPNTVLKYYQAAVAGCDRFFAHYGRPEFTHGQVAILYDRILSERELFQHLVTADCLSSRESLVRELTSLLSTPVRPSTLHPCDEARFVKHLQDNIRFELLHLGSDGEAMAWYGADSDACP
jgi:hypothetical protein